MFLDERRKLFVRPWRMGYHRVGWVGWKRIIPSKEFEHFVCRAHDLLRNISHVAAEDTPPVEMPRPVPEHIRWRAASRPIEGRIGETQPDPNEPPCRPVIRFVPSVQLLFGSEGVLLAVAGLRLSWRGQSCRCLRTRSTASESLCTSHTSGSASPLYFAASTSPSLRHSTSAYLSPRTNTMPTPPSAEATYLCRGQACFLEQGEDRAGVAHGGPIRRGCTVRVPVLTEFREPVQSLVQFRKACCLLGEKGWDKPVEMAPRLRPRRGGSLKHVSPG